MANVRGSLSWRGGEGSQARVGPAQLGPGPENPGWGRRPVAPPQSWPCVWPCQASGYKLGASNGPARGWEGAKVCSRHLINPPRGRPVGAGPALQELQDGRLWSVNYVLSTVLGPPPPQQTTQGTIILPI